jgi:hypothetical protein
LNYLRNRKRRRKNEFFNIETERHANARKERNEQRNNPFSKHDHGSDHGTP